jgi:UDP-N-acetylmuramoyl-L-alanyl-D-glutamate--2,6-diaminopimelate ligase
VCSAPFEGARVNGEDFIPQAVSAGAIAVVARPQAKVEGAVHIADANPRRLFAQSLAARFFAPFPDVCVAVTGTNGKTSTVELTRQLWRGWGTSPRPSARWASPPRSIRCIPASPRPTSSPSSPTWRPAREGITHAAFEASSHGLAQYRTEGLPVLAGAFTNLSAATISIIMATMEDYFAAKMRLFDEGRSRTLARRWSGRMTMKWSDGHRAGEGAWPEAHDRRRGWRGRIRLVIAQPTALGQKLVIEADLEQSIRSICR